MAISMRDAVRLYRQGNNAGRGWAPYQGAEGIDCIESVLAAAERDCGVIIHRRLTSDDVAVVSSIDGELIAYGADSCGLNVWAVDITDEMDDSDADICTPSECRNDCDCDSDGN